MLVALKLPPPPAQPFAFNISHVKQATASQKVPHLVALVYSLTHFGLDAYVTLCDPVSHIEATVHRGVLEAHEDFEAGAVVLLTNVSVCMIGATERHLIITPANIVKVFAVALALPKDDDFPAPASPLCLSSAAGIPPARALAEMPVIAAASKDNLTASLTPPCSMSLTVVPVDDAPGTLFSPTVPPSVPPSARIGSLKQTVAPSTSPGISASANPATGVLPRAPGTALVTDADNIDDLLADMIEAQQNPVVFASTPSGRVSEVASASAKESGTNPACADVDLLLDGLDECDLFG
eukprot:TRINITY_DN2489_c0_g1_i1.p1 TRINITY_DN2489_c0_g1~~TRINITY_DN2489_c0_g1_i1.p1  ORF type:complete len:295 (-),score=70.76 TRINITY_DN2489_c0_g1_i1:94-978(-)